jgi:hypothetical protein
MVFKRLLLVFFEAAEYVAFGQLVAFDVVARHLGTCTPSI